MIRFVNSNKAVIGEVYEQMDSILALIKDILDNDPVFQELVHNLLAEIWDKMTYPCTIWCMYLYQSIIQMLD